MPIGSGPALNWSTSQDAAGRDQGFGGRPRMAPPALQKSPAKPHGP